MAEQTSVELAFAKQQQMVTPSSIPSGAVGHSCPSSSGVCDGARLWRTELLLRGVALVASISALLFLIRDKQTQSFVVFTTTVVQEAKYSDMKALIYSVITLGIVALHSALHIVRCLVFSSNSIFPLSALAWIIFLLDQIVTYLILSSSAATAQSAWFSEQGNSGFHWIKVCNLYEKFCTQVGTGVIGAFVACMALVITSVISAFNLFARIEYAAE